MLAACGWLTAPPWLAGWQLCGAALHLQLWIFCRCSVWVSGTSPSAVLGLGPTVKLHKTHCKHEVRIRTKYPLSAILRIWTHTVHFMEKHHQFSTLLFYFVLSEKNLRENRIPGMKRAGLDIAIRKEITWFAHAVYSLLVLFTFIYDNYSYLCVYLFVFW